MFGLRERGAGRAEHPPMSLPLWGRWPSAARSEEVVPALALREPCGMGCTPGVARTCRFQRRPRCTMSLPLWGRWPSAARSDEVVPALDFANPAGWGVPLGLREPAVSIAGCRASRPETPLPFGGRWAAAQTCAGANAAPAPAQGVSPLDPFPLARSRGGGFRCSAARCRPSARRRFRGPARAWPAPCPAAHPPGQSCSGSMQSPGT